MKSKSNDQNVCCEPGCCDQISRRQFVKVSGLGLAAMGTAGSVPAIAGPFEAQDTVDHFVPVKKKLSDQWVEELFAKGERTWYSGNDLATIGMPVGGVCAGQVYLSGDGRLVYWDIFNQNTNSGYGAVNYKEGRAPTEMVVKQKQFVAAPAVDQGFALRVKSGSKTIVRSLDQRGFPNVRFCGEYPIGYVDYRANEFPLDVRLEAFSPFIPLNAKDSALPATVLNFTLTNTTDAEAEVTLAGWLQNAVLHYSGDSLMGAALRSNQVIRRDGITHLSCGVRQVERPSTPTRKPIVFADFEGDGYGDWKVDGNAFGSAPAQGTLDSQQAVSGFAGNGLVNTYLGGNDQKQGKLTSPKFTIERPFISFLVGGGSQQGKTCVNLLVDGKVVRTATGENNERLRAHNWKVNDLVGKQAHIEIVDAESAPWGHINVDQIELRDTPMVDGIADLRQQKDYGTMGLALLTDGAVSGSAGVPAGVLPDKLFDADGLAKDGRTEKSPDERLCGALGTSFKLAPGEEKTVTFVVSWCMPNMYRGGQHVGNHYATRFRSADKVAEYVAENLDRLTGETRLWHDTYYDSTLPYWLLDRLHSTVGNLASTTCQWWGNGRFWAYEGCGCCHGTCGHVWNYEHAMARLFPELERSVREMQDFTGIGLIAETGEIRFRGEGWGIWAGDSQGGYVLKAYREHQVSRDDRFLRTNWPNVKRAVEFLIKQDDDEDGLIEGRQHQTYDQDYYGANTFVGSLYLGALRAAEEMARDVGDVEFARTCKKIFAAGQKNSVERLYNGEYFVQDVDLQKHPDWQYADGCLADQMFGQGWAHQVDLGYLYPREAVLKTLESIWKYCWAPDIKRQNQQHEPARWFAYAGEAGLFTCTWPKSKHLGPKSTRYRNEVWTGIEYQVANHMAYEGMLTEALAICRAVHERYHPSKRNPFNEIECGDHYARALASWGVLLGLAGFVYHGPKQHFGFAPRITPDNFRAVFTSAEGWGTVDQRRTGDRQTNTIEVKWGELSLKTLSLALPEGRSARKIEIDGSAVEVDFSQQEQQIDIQLPAGLRIAAGERFAWLSRPDLVPAPNGKSVV